jgi:hypothetical protein
MLSHRRILSLILCSSAVAALSLITFGGVLTAAPFVAIRGVDGWRSVLVCLAAAPPDPQLNVSGTWRR